MDASDFIAEIVKVALEQQFSSKPESEKNTIMDLISNIYKAAGSKPEVLLKVKALAVEARNACLLKHLNDLSGFVSRLYPCKPPMPNSSKTR